MRNLHERSANRFRIYHPQLGIGDETCGSFVVPSPIDGADMRVIASTGEGWDHVSVSRTKRCPNWPELEFVRPPSWMVGPTKDQTIEEAVKEGTDAIARATH